MSHQPPPPSNSEDASVVIAILSCTPFEAMVDL
jgi:hypothetical protein